MSDLPKQAGDGRPFFILGAGRSGTSLLSRMLNRHPHLAVPPESHLYGMFYPWLGYYGSLAERANQAALVADILATGPLRDWSPRLQADEVLGCLHGAGFGAVVDAVMRAWALRHGKRRWGEKTPKHIHYWREIGADFEGSPVIHVVRDGRDVALSMINARFGPKTVYACALEWKAYLAQARDVKRSRASELFLEVRYEDLLDDAERVLREVCLFLGEPYAADMLAYYDDPTPYPTDARNRHNLAKPVITDNKERWRRHMTADELRVFEAVAGAELAAYGYVRAIDAAAMSAGEAWWRRRVEAPYRRSIGRLKDRKGQKERLILLGLLSRRVGLATAGRLTRGGHALPRRDLWTKDSPS